MNDVTISDTICHHDFVRLSNGHYMALQAVQHRQVREAKKDGGQRFFPAVQHSTLAEYDESGNIVWSWETSKYLKQSDLRELGRRIDLHENAFYFDENRSVIYLSMSMISRIIKIQYPSGKVLEEYGNLVSDAGTLPGATQAQIWASETKYQNNTLFCQQHALECSKSGLIYTFNNNTCSGAEENSRNPSVVAMKESGHLLEKVWDFDCGQIVGEQHLLHGGGGNIDLLPGNSVFVSMSAPYGNIFILDSNRTVLWSAITESYMPGQNIWNPVARYRASVVTRSQLAKMIWRSNAAKRIPVALNGRVRKGRKMR